jgi:hypothetical protein
LAWFDERGARLGWRVFRWEGSTCLDKHRTHADFFVPVLYVPQAATTGVAPELVRLQNAVGIGTISGLRTSKPPRKPYRRWRVFTIDKVFRTLHLIWPFIGAVKRAQAQRAMQVVLAQPHLIRGNPAFGVAGARYCLRGHDKWNARMRPFKGRGKNEEDPMNHLRQCLACVREDAEARRKKKRRP